MVVSAVAPQNLFVFRNSSDKQVEADRTKLFIGKAEIHPSKQHCQLSKKKTRLNSFEIQAEYYLSLLLLVVCKIGKQKIAEQ